MYVCMYVHIYIYIIYKNRCVGPTGGECSLLFLSSALDLPLPLSHTQCLSRAHSLTQKRHLPIPRGCIWGLQRGLSTVDSEAPEAKLTEISTAIQPEHFEGPLGGGQRLIRACRKGDRNCTYKPKLTEIIKTQVD